MDDNQLRDALDRRSVGAQFRAEELLPAVRRGIGVSPQPTRVARWAPLAGLAAAAVIVVALVIAWPRSPSVSGPAASAPIASAMELQCLVDGATSQITISDETGLIQSCSAIPVDGLGAPPAPGQGLVTSVELRLTGSPCDITAPLRFTHETARYYLRSSRPAGGSCPASLMDAAVRLNLRAPIDPSSVSVLLGAAAATQLPIQQFDCGLQITVNDHSGLIQSCEDGGIVDRHSQDPSVSNPSGDLHTVHVWWGISESSTVTAIDVYRTSDDAYYISVVTVASPDSFFRPDAHAVDLVFNVPVPASTVTVRTYSGASASIAPSQSALRHDVSGQSGDNAAASSLPSPTPTGYSVQIADGLKPNWTATAAASHVFDEIKSNEQSLGQTVRPAQIISVEAMRGSDVPRAVSGPYGDVNIVWVVHAYGTFEETRSYSGGPYLYSEGWYIFDDDTGHIVGESLTPSVATP